MKILVVEDEAPVADMLCRLLEEQGNHCRVAGDTDRADTVLAEEPIEAVTLDLGMPGRHGLGWLEELARDRPGLARRTLVITGETLDTDAVARLAACGAGVLAKPFTLESFQDAVRAQIAHEDRGGAD